MSAYEHCVCAPLWGSKSTQCYQDIERREIKNHMIDEIFWNMKLYINICLQNY